MYQGVTNYYQEYENADGNLQNSHLSLTSLTFDKLLRSKLHAWNSLSSKMPKSCLEQKLTGIIHMLKMLKNFVCICGEELTCRMYT